MKFKTVLHIAQVFCWLWYPCYADVNENSSGTEGKTIPVKKHLNANDAVTSAIVINEVMFNPDGDENAREFVELLNISDGPVSLERFVIGDGTGFDLITPAEEGMWTVPAGEYALIMDLDYFDSAEPYEDIPTDTPLFSVSDKAIGMQGLSNSTPEPVYLIDGSGDTLSVVIYSLDCPQGHSWERIMPMGDDSTDNFLPSQHTDGTPGQKNSVTPSEYNPAIDDNSLRFLPSSPNMGDELEMKLSYRNSGLGYASDVEVIVWMLPETEIGTVLFTENVNTGQVSGEMSLTLDNLPGGKLAFTAAVVSSDTRQSTADDTLRVMLEVPVSEGAIILNEIMAAPLEEKPEWVELFNTGDSPVDLFEWSVIDERGTPVGIVPEHIFINEEAYAVIADEPLDITVPEQFVIVLVDRFPTLNNDGDTITILDFKGAVMDSMSYDSTTKGYSLELISETMRGKSSGWDVCVDPSGTTHGRANSILFNASGDDNNINSPKLTIDPNPFSEITNISYELPFPIARVHLYVYDRRGRIVARLRDVEESGSSWTSVWDGKSEGTRLPAGPYILVLEVIDKRTGQVMSARKTVIVASKL